MDLRLNQQGSSKLEHRISLVSYRFTSLPSSYLRSQPTLHYPDVEMRSCCLIHFHTAVGNHKHCFTWEFHISCPQRTKLYQLGLLEEKWQVRDNVLEFRKCLIIYTFINPSKKLSPKSIYSFKFYLLTARHYTRQLKCNKQDRHCPALVELTA